MGPCCAVGHELVASYSGVSVHQERTWCGLQFTAWCGEGGAGRHAVWNSCPLEEGLGLERSYGQVSDLLAMGASDTQVLRTKYNTGLGWRSICPRLQCIQGFKEEFTAPRDPGQNGHEWLHGQQSTVRGQAGGPESRDCSFTQRSLHQYSAGAFQGMPGPRQWASITEC